MKEKSTGDLSFELMSQPNLDAYLSQNEDCFTNQSAAEFLIVYFQRSGMTKAALARKAGMSEVYLHQVFSGRRNPSRDRLLCLCVCLELSLEETQQLLKEACHAPLYPRNRRDSIITYGVLHRQALAEINEKLFEENEKTLF
ncbi:helix-turn-helix domain-containing protein [Pseudoflavonifractor phocaeensis]|uniref:helix-turn-helix domain-containing protein n=1 Tax=Pseudoflavonifractor phocaeensis TaxID=1870988 RepID=UPI00195EF023|nr:helix-turn-helix transcriptional regulator [Pseudoflavonifractor phocaeensis]MBM6927134.1 helix-turn-helix transcriptional regulator [Pseudoflavonifractor phocaeensis]